MMRNLIAVVCSLVLSTAAWAASGKISSQWKCDGKPVDTHSIAVPDHEGHNYSIAKGNCTPEKGSIGDAKEQEGTYTEFDDVNGNKVQNHGVFTDTVAGGDKIFYHYHGNQTFKDGKMEEGTNSWTFGGGTGKFEGVKGAGTCKGKGNPDGSSTWTCEGTYTTAK